MYIEVVDVHKNCIIAAAELTELSKLNKYGAVTVYDQSSKEEIKERKLKPLLNGKRL